MNKLELEVEVAQENTDTLLEDNEDAEEFPNDWDKPVADEEDW